MEEAHVFPLGLEKQAAVLRTAYGEDGLQEPGPQSYSLKKLNSAKNPRTLMSLEEDLELQMKTYKVPKYPENPDPDPQKQRQELCVVLSYDICGYV